MKNNKEFEVHENLCVDNDFVPNEETVIAKKKTLLDAIRFAQDFCSENLVEYGYWIDGECLK